MTVSLIGLDGATPKLIRPLLSNGELPNLKRLSENGFSGQLNSTVPSRTSPAIPALYTGCDPSELGFIGFKKPNGDSITLADIDLPRIWSILDEHGHSSCIVNVRTTYPPDEIDGVMVSGDPAPGEESQYYHPPEIYDRVQGFRMEELDKRRHEELVPAVQHAEEVVDISIDILNQRAKTFLELTSKAEHQFQMFWIGGSDFLQHRLWNQKEQLQRFYKEADQVIGDIIDTVEGDVFVVSDHGFSPPAKWRLYLNSWLHEHGYLKLIGGKIGGSLLLRGQQLAREFIPAKYLRSILQYRNTDTDSQESGPPWYDSTYETLPGISSTSLARLSNSSGISIKRLNNQGMVEQLISELKSLTTPSDNLAFKNVWRRDRLYRDGRFLQHLPEIVVQANDDIFIDPQITDSVFERIEPSRASHIHARDGIWFGGGPRVASIEGHPEGDIVDVAPTLLHLMNLPVGENMHGVVRHELLSDSGEVSKADYRDIDEKTELTESEENEMEEWLENMGYK